MGWISIGLCLALLNKQVVWNNQSLFLLEPSMKRTWSAQFAKAALNPVKTLPYYLRKEPMPRITQAKKQVVTYLWRLEIKSTPRVFVTSVTDVGSTDKRTLKGNLSRKNRLQPPYQIFSSTLLFFEELPILWSSSEIMRDHKSLIRWSLCSMNS